MLAEWSAHGEQLPVEPEHITVVEVFAAFWKHAQTYYVQRDGTPTSRQSVFLRAMKPAWPPTIVASLGGVLAAISSTGTLRKICASKSVAIFASVSRPSKLLCPLTRLDRVLTVSRGGG